jgi:3-hydroxyisobutyrate dehydrogenase-like beta-hydroxyacid dehydrogenase
MTKKVLEGEHMSETIGFIGLGDLGQPIARNLLAAGYALKVYNCTASKAEPLVALGAERKGENEWFDLALF